MERYDVVVIGAGPGGLAAGAAARKNGAERVLILEREDRAGGILNQCIHDGFGIHRYRAQLSGPEYAARAEREARESGVQIQTGCMVTELTPERVVTAVGRGGMKRYCADAVVLATGCRERTRGMISTPGTRPAGIFTAGVAQNLVNVRNVMIGRRIVILGSGDIGLIMARRLTLEGAQVLAVAEIMPEPCGLARNVSQCLYDFHIPLYLSCTVTRIIGKKRLEAVELSQVDEQMRPIPGTERTIACDTLVLSVGLIPENEVAKGAGVCLDKGGNGTLTDEFLQTSVPGIFSCGNSRHVMDLADFVSEQGEAAGANAARFAKGEPLKPWTDDKQNPMAKGLPAPGSVVCTLCPNGCQIVMTQDGKTSGNRCPRGRAFAEQEVRSPERVLTTTVRVTGANGPLLAVRSDRPVKRAEMRALVERLRGESVQAPVKAGQTILEGVGENGVNIIAQTEMNR